MDLLIRPVQPGDAAQLRDNIYSANTLAQVEDRIAAARRATRAGDEVHLVAVVDGVVAGTGGLIRNERPLYGHRAELVDIVVHPEYQRRGIARQVVDALCARAAEIGIVVLETSCRGGTPAEAVYPRLGFREWGRLPCGIVEPWDGGQTYDEVCFYMLLGRGD
jgi:GNAT superfamily N-acetyltransferase